MSNEFNRMDRDIKILLIMMNTRYTEDALKRMPDEKLDELYQLKVENK